MCSPKQSDRVGVRDPQIMNLALDAIFLCRKVSSERAWWKKALQKKYMAGNKRNCVDNMNMRELGLQFGISAKKQCTSSTRIFIEQQEMEKESKYGMIKLEQIPGLTFSRN